MVDAGLVSTTIRVIDQSDSVLVAFNVNYMVWPHSHLTGTGGSMREFTSPIPSQLEIGHNMPKHLYAYPATTESVPRTPIWMSEHSPSVVDIVMLYLGVVVILAVITMGMVAFRQG